MKLQIFHEDTIGERSGAGRNVNYGDAYRVNANRCVPMFILPLDFDSRLFYS